MKIRPFKAKCQNNHKISGSFEETSKSFFLIYNNKNTLKNRRCKNLWTSKKDAQTSGRIVVNRRG